MHDNANLITAAPKRAPWNKGKLIGPRPPLRQKHVWAIRTWLHIEQQTRDLALFNLAIDSKLRGCDVVAVRVDDVAPNGYALERATVRQKKTGRPVRFELTEQTRQAIGAKAIQRAARRGFRRCRKRRCRKRPRAIRPGPCEKSTKNPPMIATFFEKLVNCA